MKTQFALISILLLLVSTAFLCFESGNGTEPPPTPSDSDESIGTVSRERNQVDHRHADGDFQQLTGTNPLFNGDGLQVTQGGEGLLDFGDHLRLRLFNDSELGGITAKSAPDTPLSARMTLERGGFTGHLTQEGSQVAFSTPGGATITIFGTEFFVIYDEVSGQTAAGNFDGEMEVSAEGSTVQVPAGNFVVVPAGRQPEPPQSPIPFSLAGFEELSREDGSPVAALPLLVPTPTPTSTATPTPTHTLTPEPTNTPTLTPTPTPAVLIDFVDRAWTATWFGSDGELPFPGEDTDDRGFVLWRDNFRLEDGSMPERILETHPTWESNGYISGWYSLSDENIVIQRGDRIVTRVGFLNGARAGDVTFNVIINYGSYATGCGEFGCEQEFTLFDQYDGDLRDGEYYFPERAFGQVINSVRVVAEAGESSSQDWAVWVEARLERPWQTTTPSPNPSINFTLTPSTIYTYRDPRCTTLTWEVENISGVFLNGERLDDHGTERRCPTSTTTYTLDILRYDGQIENPSVRVNVIQDTVIPTVNLLDISPATISVPGGCGTGTTQITVEALDEVGIEGVTAEWVKGQENDQVLMERIDDQTFSAEIGPVSTAGEVSITVIAQDTSGNWSKPLLISVDAFYCVE